jgi:hypothetical protein
VRCAPLNQQYLLITFNKMRHKVNKTLLQYPIIDPAAAQAQNVPVP